MARTGKFYYKNEKEIMRDLGFKPTAASGSGWLEKEDGQSEFAIAQLKSTDAESIKVNLMDIKVLEHNALVSHKRPVFVIQYLKTNDIFLVIRPEKDVLDILHKHFDNKSIELGEQLHESIDDIIISEASLLSRDNFIKERDKTYAKEDEVKRKLRRSLGKEKPKRQLEPELPI